MNLCRDDSVPEQVGVVFPPFFSHGRAHGCAAAWIVLLLLPETMWCLRLLLLVVLLPWSSSVKREHTPAGTPLISESFGEVSSAPADAVSSATPTSPLPPCRLIASHIPGTENYMTERRRELFAMHDALGQPIYFATASHADTSAT